MLRKPRPAKKVIHNVGREAKQVARPTLGRKAGRPRLTAREKRVRVSMTVSRDVLHDVDTRRGRISRSRFIETVLDSQAHDAPACLSLEQKLLGAVYTPSDLASYVASKVVSFLLKEPPSTSIGCAGRATADAAAWCFMDPACGEGELLAALSRQFDSQYDRWGGVQGLTRLRVANPILCGIDIDGRAVSHAKSRLADINVRFADGSTKFISTNALFPFGASTAREGWSRILRMLDSPNGVDIIIANPPWGADVSAYRDALDRGEYSLYQGQFDTSDLFIEMALSVLKPGGYLAFIVPDSLFNEERTKLRELLLSKTEIKYLARLGEKLFNGINRACAVVICRKAGNGNQNTTECLRLTPAARKSIIDGTSTFSEAEASLVHRVPQRRFAANRGFSFDIDVTVAEEPTIRKFKRCVATFGLHLQSTRGVELSKRGLVCRCSSCGLWVPAPERSVPRCIHCGQNLDTGRSELASIVSEMPLPNCVQFLVGESVRRYQIAPGLWIDTSKSGIDYKDASIYAAPKLLVRKTGVGISAAMDYTKSFTNQVVYIFSNKWTLGGAIPLECFLGVLNSRALYYYLTKTCGETEWRSHPYVTQGQILSLPFPQVDGEGTDHRRTLSEMAVLLRPYTRDNRVPPPHVDAQVEQLVAQLYGLGPVDYRRIYAMLDSVEGLLPVRNLRQVAVSDVFGAAAST